MTIIGIILIIVGILLPLIINKTPLRVLIEPTAVQIVAVVIVIYCFNSLKNASLNEKIKKSINNDILYRSSIIGLFIGVTTGIIQIISNLYDKSAIGPGFSLVILSILYGLLCGQIFKIVKSANDLDKIKCGKVAFSNYILFMFYIIICLSAFFVIIYLSNFDFQKIFVLEDLLSYIIILLGIIFASKKYKIINIWLNNDTRGNDPKLIDVSLNDLSIAAVQAGIMVSMIRFLIFMCSLSSFEAISDLIGISLFPIIYGLITGFLIIKPMSGLSSKSFL